MQRYVLSLSKPKLITLFLGMTIIIAVGIPHFLKFAEAAKNDGNNNSKQVNSNNDVDFQEKNSIMICCAWSNKLADGVLTYNIIGSSGKGNEQLKQAVRDGINDWGTAIPSLKFTEISGKNNPADIML